MDDLDHVLRRFAGRQYEKAILFCDNAGSDVVLGAPLGRGACQGLSPVRCTDNSAATSVLGGASLACNNAFPYILI